MKKERVGEEERGKKKGGGAGERKEEENLINVGNFETQTVKPCNSCWPRNDYNPNEMNKMMTKTEKEENN